jgi:hypothetical protein
MPSEGETGKGRKTSQRKQEHITLTAIYERERLRKRKNKKIKPQTNPLWV